MRNNQEYEIVLYQIDDTSICVADLYGMLCSHFCYMCND